MKTILIPLFTVFLAAPLTLHAQQSTLGEGDSYAWAGNIGWLELTPSRPNYYDGVRVTDTCFSGFAWSDSTGWINFGDGTPANNIRYANIDGADSGVNHDGMGNLSGLAWSANLGWINFGWAASNDPNRPRFDLYSGGFSGYAWSASAGWIHLGTGILKTDIMAITDADADGISDTWELEHAPTLNVLTSMGDADGDGISDQAEYQADTNPSSAQSYFKVTNIAPVNLNGTATALTWTSSPARRYVIDRSIDLGSADPWHPSPLDAPSFGADAGDQTTRTTLDVASPQRFFRVKAVVPLQP